MKTDTKKLLVITDCSFPNSALASRVMSFIYLFNSLDFNIHVLLTKLDEKHFDKKYFETNNITYQNVKSSRSERLQSMLGNENIKSALNNYLTNNPTDYVFMTSMGVDFKKVFDICKKHNVKVILEQCEWYDVSSFRYQYIDPRYIKFINNFKYNYKKVNGVISISRLLNKYYKENNVNTIIIPSIFDVKNSEYNTDVDLEKIKLVYSGSTGISKECLKPILKVMNSSDKYKNSFILDIYGINENDVLNNIDNQKELLNDNIKIHGKVDYNELKNALLNSNYQIFIKPERRSSNAQFPTKLAESMMYGLPVITNDTGDIGLYLNNEENGYLCNPDNIEDVFDKILQLDENTYKSQRINARKTAENNFDYRNYIEKMKELIDLI